ncbi:MAG: hypothetical protein DMG17_12115, partial [Acidobacteria bacterium]
MAWRASGNLSRRPYFLSCGLPLNCLNEEVGGMARQGWSMSEMEIRRIAYLLSETDLVVAAIAERMDCSKSAMNVEYRLARVSQAPAAVEDCLCALRWVMRNAKQYGFDTAKLVVSGGSAGGHLALTTGMIPASEGLDRQCPGTEQLRVAAIVDWYGITDVADLLDGENMRTFAVEWLGSRPNRFEIAKRVSPLAYVRPGIPPIISIQGDADPVVPY